MTILIADDDRIHVQIVSSRLKNEGFQVLAAFDAMQAFTIAIRNLPAVILLDVNMPGGTGLEVLKRLKNSSKTNQIPVIVVSGSMDASAANSVKELGADEFIRKPVNFEKLHGAARRMTGPPAAHAA